MNNIIYRIVVVSTLFVLCLFSVQAQEYNFADNTLSMSQIVNQWQDHEFYTATTTDHPNIKDYFFSFTFAYPNELCINMLARLAGLEHEGVGNFVVDPANGFIGGELLTELSPKMQMCYWNCSDGSRLVGVLLQGHEYKPTYKEYEETEYNDDMTFCYTDLMFFRLTNEDLIWHPVKPEQLCGRSINFRYFNIELPRRGKDITLTRTFGDGKSYKLKWNGTKFTVVTL